MKKIFIGLCALICFCPSTSSAGITKDNILVVYNATGGLSGNVSYNVATYYRDRRGLDNSQLFGVTVTTSDFDRSMTYTDYKNQVEIPVLNRIAQLENEGRKIDIILLTHKMPTLIKEGGPYFTHDWWPIAGVGFLTRWASLDSELAASLLGSGGQANAFNPYSQAGGTLYGFDKNQYNMFLVMRIDGPSPSSSNALVDRAMQFENEGYTLSGKGYFDKRSSYSTDSQIQLAYNVFNSAGMTGVLESTTNNTLMSQAVHVGNDALFYWGWYDGPSQHYAANGSWFQWKPGSIGASVWSGGAHHLKLVADEWCPFMIQDGITGTQASVDEGTTVAYSRPEILLTFMLAGATYAEACYASTSSLSWMQVFIGDPLFKWKAQSTLVYPGGSGPSAEANGPYSVNEGTPITFQGNGSGDVISWEWDLTGDSIYETLGQNPAKTYTDNLSITVRLRVTNSGAQTATDTASLTVSNVAPSLTAVAVDETVISPGSSVHITGNYADPGSSDTHTVLVDWGEGVGAVQQSVSGGSFSLSHTYSASGTYNGTLQIRDDDGGLSVVEPFSITVNSNTAPSADAHGNYITDEGSPLSFSGSATDPDSGDTLSYEWDLNGDGAYETTEQNPSAVYYDNALFTVTLRVTDQGGLSDTDTALLTVNNAAPVITSFAVNLTDVLQGDVLTISGNYTDAGTLDTHEAVINWGDTSETRTVSGGTFSFSHRYLVQGTYNASIEIRDDDGGYSVPSYFPITVCPLPKPQISLAGFGLVAISWTTKTGKTYIVEYSDGDSNGALGTQAVFTEIPESLVTETSTPPNGEQYIDNVNVNIPAHGRRYYRVKLIQNI